MSLIAIAHLPASGGREIGKMVAHELHLPYIDQEIVQGVAHKLGISEALANSLDEKAERLVDQILTSLRHGLAFELPQMEPNEAMEVDLTEYQQATRDILTTVAASHHAVIAGHGANFFLRGRTCFYSVFVYGSLENRVERLMKREVINRAEALKRLHKSDHEKAFYIKSLYGANWSDPAYYQLVINTDYMSLGSAAHQIIELVR
jgi:CMP/dCMP kinase